MSKLDSLYQQHLFNDTLTADYCKDHDPRCVGSVPLFGRPLSEMDTAYVFQATAGWGVFDMLCALYRDSDSRYKSRLIRLLKPKELIGNNEKFEYEVVDSTIDRYTWNRLGQILSDSSFWCLPYDLEPISTSIDGLDFHLVVKEGNHKRVVFFQNIPTKHPDGANFTYKIGPALQLITSSCNFPEFKYRAMILPYNKDSFLLEIFHDHNINFINNRVVVSFASRQISSFSGANSFFNLKLPNSVLDSLTFLSMEAEFFDGTRRPISLTIF